MEDPKIVELYFQRDEEAIRQTQQKYGLYCYSIAHNILRCREDAQEAVNDTYMTAWERIPPEKPSFLGAFLGKITRHIAIDRWRACRADKRGGGEVPLVLEELGECAAQGQDVEQAFAQKQAVRAYIAFLKGLPITERRVFLCRYWHMESIEAISDMFGFSKSKVKTMLHRTRCKLRKALAQEGYE